MAEQRLKLAHVASSRQTGRAGIGVCPICACKARVMAWQLWSPPVHRAGLSQPTHHQRVAS